MSEKEKKSGQPRQRRKKKNSDSEEKIMPRGPSDTKVVLIKSDQLVALRKESSQRRNSESTPPIYDSTQFPSLGRDILERPPPPLTSHWGTVKYCKQSPEVDTSTASKHFLQSTNMRSPLGEDTTVFEKLKKSKRPILFDVSTAITVKVAVREGSHVDHRPIVVPQFCWYISKKDLKLELYGAGPLKSEKKLRKTITAQKKYKSSRSVLSGNILDSSQPVRSKGKFRERKKTKLSPLKESIIKERILKLLAKNKGDSELDVESIDFKKEINVYLKRLQDNKASSTRARKAKQGHEQIPKLPTNCSFTSKFRSYCENVLTLELNEAVKIFVKNLVQLQDRAFERDPVRARSHRRFVVGIREAKKYLKLNRVQLLIIAPDLEVASPESAMGTCISELKEEAKNANICYLFALDRRKLGYCSLRKAPISAIAVMRYEGLEVMFEEVMKTYNAAREIYLSNFCPEEEVKLWTTPDVISKILDNLKLSNP